MKQASFVDEELVEETGLNSSPVTTGILVRARKKSKERGKSMVDTFNTSQIKTASKNR